MNASLRMTMLVVVLEVSILLTACGGGSAPPPAARPSGDSTGPVTLEISSLGEQLAYDKTALAVFAGQQVTLKLTDTSTAQQHNWILVRGDDAVAQKIATDGLLAGLAKSYLPEDMSNIIAHAPLANAGQTVEVTFTAPAAGTYIFICTVPGHYPLMKGSLTVS